MIEHTIPLAEYMAIENPVNRQVTLMEKLRALGMPIVGPICIERVERGSLTISFDDLFETIRWTWSE